MSRVGTTTTTEARPRPSPAIRSAAMTWPVAACVKEPPLLDAMLDGRTVIVVGELSTTRSSGASSFTPYAETLK